MTLLQSIFVVKEAPNLEWARFPYSAIKISSDNMKYNQIPNQWSDNFPPNIKVDSFIHSSEQEYGCINIFAQRVYIMNQHNIPLHQLEW